MSKLSDAEIRGSQVLETAFNKRNPKPAGCDGCPFRSDGIGFAPPAPYAGQPVALVGSHSGNDEAYAGRPFVKSAPTGRELHYWLHQAGLREDEVWLTNIIWCFFPARIDGTARRRPQGGFIGRDPSRNEGRECAERHLRPSLRAAQATGNLRLLVTAGVFATRELVDPKASPRATGALDWLPEGIEI